MRLVLVKSGFSASLWLATICVFDMATYTMSFLNLPIQSMRTPTHRTNINQSVSLIREIQPPMMGVCSEVTSSREGCFSGSKSRTRKWPKMMKTGRGVNALKFRGGATATGSSVDMLPSAVASLLSGSVAGAIGVGVAFPFDTLKTKAQVMPTSALAQTTLSSTAATTMTPSVTVTSNELNMLQMTKLIYEMEGISGFFGGVRTMMIGQAFIKAVAFASNNFALYMIRENPGFRDSVILQALGISSHPVCQLILAACFAGFTSSFLVAPVERIKVMMQAQGGGASSAYKNELECIKAVLKNEGWAGLLGRGLGPTLAREVPSYAIYFVVYGILSQSYLAKEIIGPNFSPLIFGAISGMACWLPVYPIDVVKTLIQNSDGQEDENGNRSDDAITVTKMLYEKGGIGAFFDGLTPKMIRAAVNHSVTFFVYDLVMRTLSS